MRNPVRRKWMIVGGVLVLAALTVFVLFTFIKAPVRTKNEAIAVCARILESRYSSSFSAKENNVTALDYGDVWIVKFQPVDPEGKACEQETVKISKQDRSEYEINP